MLLQETAAVSDWNRSPERCKEKSERISEYGFVFF